ncbi:MAG: UDP-3-O-(3-hydroxymyristoyl)glucosamine N-acyltransferase [Candidatus Hydrogenedentes bacterium]|nr:UDP-3-O-(3-hydroxymyristoyl)glucosamine N-acyltransferase [Candidatus Hydrogenedentota bacterium]
MSLRVSEILNIVGGRLVFGSPDTIVTGVGSIESPKSGDIVFVRDKKYERFLSNTNASAVLIPFEPTVKLPPNLACIIVDFPEVAFLKLIEYFYPQKNPFPYGVHSNSVVEEGVTFGENVSVAPFVYIGRGTKIGNGVIVYPHVYIGEQCEIGENTIIYPNVTIRELSVIGARCIIHSGVCIGSDGFGFVFDGERWQKIPQVGRVVIDDDVEIGSNTCIDRATLGETIIGSGTKLDNLVQVGHNVRIGKHCVVAGTTGIAGSATIGDYVRIGAGAGINGHIEIGNHVSIGAWSGVAKSVEPGKTVSGFPAVEHSLARKIMVSQQHLPEILRKLKELQTRVDKIESRVYGEPTNNR